MPRTPFVIAVGPALALVAGGVRWALQGSGNLYTATSKRFYVPDPDFGWREAAGKPLWLGLEVLAVIAAIAIGVALSLGALHHAMVHASAVAHVVGVA